ncbi:MAG: hypothetical protein KJ000_32110 [Pirellulaceae bacterium]|nr:hypothetical protein [Pirellulaceae bacterium]
MTGWNTWRRRRAFGWADRFRPVWLAVAACVAAVVATGAEPPPSPADATPPLHFRRVFVADEDLSKLKLDGVYLPVKREVFERLVRSAAGGGAADETLQTRMDRATYTARLIGTQRLDGEAELEIHHRGERESAILLEPWNLVIKDIRWQSAESPARPDEGGAPQPPLQAGFDEHGQFTARVSGSGTLNLDWTLRSLPDSDGRPSFVIRLPECPLTRILLDLPDSLRPVSSHGFLTLDSRGVQDGSWNRWALDVGDQARLYLRIVPVEEAGSTAREMLVRQESIYRFTPQDADLTVDLRLDVFDEPLSQLALTADPALSVVEATCGGRPLRWTENLAEGRRELLLEMPEPLIGLEHRLRLRALAPAELGRPWQLPMVRVEKGLWSHGTVRLEMPRPLVLEKLTVRGCRELGSPPSSAPGAADAVTIECFDPQAEIAVRLGVPPGKVFVRRGTSINLGRSRTSLVQSAQFSTDGAPRFELTLAAPWAWSVDQIESQPPEAIEEWSFIGRSGASRLIQIRLRNPLAPNQPFSLKVHAHGDGLRSGARLTGEALRLGEYQDTVSSSSLFALTAEPPHQVRLTGDGQLERLAAASLEPDEQGMLTVSAGSVVFREGPAMDEMTVDLRSEPPDYAVRIDTECEVGERKLDLLYRIRLQPKSSTVDRVQIHFTGAPDQRLNWSQPGGELLLTAKRVPLDATAGSGETWQVTLPQPLDAPFELLASQTIDFEGETLLPLAALPGAASQIGTVTIRSADPLPLQFTSQNVRPVPAQPLAPGRYNTTRAVYRYDPSQDCRIAVQRAAESVPRSLAWVWSCDLVTRHYRDGTTLHVAEYRVESGGAAELTLTTQTPVEWLSARVDGRDVQLEHNATDSTRLSVPLPRGVRFPTVQVRYVTQGEPLGAIGNIGATWPRCDQRVFRQSWVAWLPPGFECVPGSVSPAADTWQQRLFGDLLRPPEERPFVPLSREGWAAVVRPSKDPAAAAETRRSAKWLQDLWTEYRKLGETASEESLVTWGRVLRVWQASEGGNRNGSPDVWVDQLALGGEGISAQSLVPATPMPPTGVTEDGSATSPGGSLLAAAGLTVLTDGDRLLLTTVRGLFDRSSVEDAAGAPGVSVLAPGESQRLLAQQPAGLRWIRLESWIDRPPLPQACWQHSGIPSLHQAGEIAGDSGWTSQRIPPAVFQAVPADAVRWSRVPVYQPVVLRSLGWAALLASTGLAVWLLRRRLSLAWLLIAGTGAAALLVPLLWAPVVQFLFLGTVLGALIALIRAARAGRGASLPEREQLTTTSLFVQTLAVLALLAGLAGRAGTAQGAEPSANPAPTAAPIYQILSPIDPQGEPDGEYVFVPQDFYEALSAPSAQRVGESQQWMIYDASYQATMSWNATEEKLSVLELTATYEMEVFQPGAVVRLPMVESQAHLLPNRALLDGRPATIRWLDDEGGLALDVDAAGRYRVALAFRPHVLRDGDYDRFEVTIPRVGNSRMRIELPAEIRGLTFPTAMGVSEPDLGAGNWLIQLGPTDRLVARWPADVEQSALRESLELDQLMWLSIRPDAVQLDVRLRFSQLVSPIARVALIADHRLRLLPPSDDAPIAWYESTRGPAQIIHLEFKPPHRQDLQIDLSFALEETAAVGNIRLPELTCSADRLSRRWLAVTVAPSLERQTETPAKDSGPSPADFLAAWGSADSAPQLVIDSASLDPPDRLTVYPREAPTTARQQTEIVCRPNAADLVLQADLLSVAGPRLQYEVNLPPAVIVDRVTVEEAGQPRLKHWSRDQQGQLNLRLNQPLTLEHRLRIHGRMDIAAPPRGDSSLTVPVWSVVGTGVESRHVDIYRREQAQVRTVESEGYQVREDFVEGLYVPGRGRWVAALAADSAAAESRLKLLATRNRPQTSGQMVTAVRREMDGWWAEVDLRLKVAGGLLDALRLEIPADWKGPFDVTQGMTTVLFELPGKGRCYLLIRPERAVLGDLQVRLRGPISAAAHERIRVPDIVLLDVERIESYVLMPTKVDQQRIVWERSGLQAKPLPETLRPLRGPSDLPYGTIQPRFQATIKDIQLESGSAFVRLADHCIDFDADGRICGVSTFDLQPAGRSECSLIVPEGCQLLSLSVADLPVVPLPGEERQVRVPLGSQQLAQRIEVLFADQIDRNLAPSATQPLRVPSLQGLTVEQTCWTIRHPAGAAWQVVPAASLTDPQALDWVRIRNLAGMISKAEDVLKDGDSDEIARWYVPWTRRWATARSRLAPASLAADESARQAVQELVAFDENHRRIAERLGVQAHTLVAEQEARRAYESSDVWRLAASPQQVTAALIASAPSEIPRIKRADDHRAVGDARLAALTFLAGLTLVAMLLLPHPSLDDPLRRHPELLGVVFGAIWWWAFAASAAGFVLFALSLAAFLLRTAKRRRLRLGQIRGHAAT